MKKICGVGWMALVLILGVLDNASAHNFSAKINSDFPSRAPGRDMQVAQAAPATEDSSLAGSAFSDFENRFAKHQYQFGLSLGYGFNFNLPPTGLPAAQRSKFKFAYFFPNFKYNLTGLIGSSFYQGALYWVMEVGAAVTVTDPTQNNRQIKNGPNYVLGLVPAQLEYKFIGPGRSWAPFLYAGVGGSWGDWYEETREISTPFEFILQTGVGLEYFYANGMAINLQYRFWHLSNSNVQSPNIGINAHVVTLGFSF